MWVGGEAIGDDAQQSYIELGKRSLHVGGGLFIWCWNYALMVGIVRFAECHQNQDWGDDWVLPNTWV